MPEINLLARYPKSKRNIEKRHEAQTPENIALSRQYGFEYFDGPRELGYGGYRYDGRWIPIAEDMVAHFKLKPGDRVLDVGCAKGFLVKDLMKVCPGLEVFGLDISSYAVMNSEPEVVGRLHLGCASKLPFPDKIFDAVISINAIHNLEGEKLLSSLREIMRVSKDGRAYVQVDSYRTPEDRELFLSWVLTAYTHDYPENWEKIFAQAGYTGDYYWTIL
jgi:ubiquinone/menaquinone biosynthesis C-methylase UbiE